MRFVMALALVLLVSGCAAKPTPTARPHLVSVNDSVEVWRGEVTYVNSPPDVYYRTRINGRVTDWQEAK